MPFRLANLLLRNRRIVGLANIFRQRPLDAFDLAQGMNRRG